MSLLLKPKPRQQGKKMKRLYWGLLSLQMDSLEVHFKANGALQEVSCCRHWEEGCFWSATFILHNTVLILFCLFSFMGKKRKKWRYLTMGTLFTGLCYSDNSPYLFMSCVVLSSFEIFSPYAPIFKDLSPLLLCLSILFVT